MKKILAIASLLILSSCAAGHLSTQGPKQADKCSVTYFSFLKNIDSPELSACGSSVTASKSRNEDMGYVVPLLEKVLIK